MIRFVLGIFGATFSAITLGLVFAALGVGGLLYLYSHDLPDHDTLSNYAPPTISRIYSREGVVVDEFATERRLFVASAEIPDMVANAFISAEDRNFWEHPGYDPRAIAAAFVEAGADPRPVRARRLDDHAAGDEELPPRRKPDHRAQGARASSSRPGSKGRCRRSVFSNFISTRSFSARTPTGVAAAAQTYFKRAASRTWTLEQAAYLAALPQAPSTPSTPVRDYRPGDQPPQLRAARDVRKTAISTRRSFSAASCSPRSRPCRAGISSPTAPPSRRGTHFTDEIRRQFSAPIRRGRFLYRRLCRGAPRWTRTCSAWPRARSAARWKDFDRESGPLARAGRPDRSRASGWRRGGLARGAGRGRGSRATSTAGTPPVVLEVGESSCAHRDRGRGRGRGRPFHPGRGCHMGPARGRGRERGGLRPASLVIC